MSYTVSEVYRPQFRGVVTEVFVGGRPVGYVYRDPNAGEEATSDQWMARADATRPVSSKEEGVRVVVEYAEAHPDHVLT